MRRAASAIVSRNFGAAMPNLRSVAVAANDKLWDGLIGVDTAGADCRPTTYHVLRSLFRKLPLTAADHFIDIGCGRGRALCLAAQQPVATVTGVEIVPEHAAAARRNLERMYGRKAGNWSVLTSSASDLDLSGGTIFYLYNPFQGSLFAQVVDNIRRNASQARRPIRVVYVNPICRDMLDAADWLAPAEALHRDRQGNVAALLYRSR